MGKRIAKSYRIPKVSLLKMQNPIPQKDALNHIMSSGLRYPPTNEKLIQSILNSSETMEDTSSFRNDVNQDMLGNNPSNFTLPTGDYVDLPFFVQRTSSSQLPVYLDYKNGRTRVVTLLRKIHGDVDACEYEISQLIPEEIQRKSGGQLLIPGNHKKILHLWLRVMGF